MPRSLAWQVWHLRAGSGGALGPRQRPVSPLAWQVWRLVTSALTHLSFTPSSCTYISAARNPFTNTSSTYISFTHMQSHLFLMTHLSHTNLPPTALERTTLSFTHIPSTCSTFADNFFTRTFVNSCTRNSFTGNTFAYNSLQLSVLRHLNFRAFPVQIQSLFVIIGRS